MNADDARAEQARVEAQIRAERQLTSEIWRHSVKEAVAKCEELKRSRNVWRAIAIGNGALALGVWVF